MERSFYYKNTLIVLAIVALNLLGCTKIDTLENNDFYIDLTNGNVTDRNGNYLSTIPDYYNLYNVGGYVYANQAIVFKGIDANYYAVTQYCSYDNCNVQYQVAYDRLYCACCGSLFYSDGSVQMGPAQLPLNPFAVVRNVDLLHVYTP